MATPVCPSCGAEVRSGSNFCLSCFARLPSELVAQGAAAERTRSTVPGASQPQYAAGLVATPGNTSGMGKAHAAPPEVRKWSWGAFLLTWIWGLAHRVWFGLLMFVPIVNIVAWFVLGAKGNEWAWQRQRWDSVEAFKRTQRRWAVAGLIWILLVSGGIVWAVNRDAGLDRLAKQSIVVNDADGKFSLTVPGDWKSDGSLNDDAAIGASNGRREMYVVVFVNSTKDFKRGISLREVASFGQKNIQSSFKDPTRLSGPRKVRIGGRAGLRYEFESVEGIVRIHSLYSVTKTPGAFVEILTWTLAGKIKENRPTLEKVVASLRAS